jgi:hypothetical protein
MPDKIIVNQNELGKNILKNGIFGNSTLTPLGTFSNRPKYYEYQATKNSEDKLVLTLQRVKDGLKAQLKAEQGLEFEDDDELVEKFLFEFTSLLIDYRDLRNYVFFGSAYTELAYNIKYIVENYPYKFLISSPTEGFNGGSSLIGISSVVADETLITFKQEAIKDGIEEFNFYDNNIDFNWLAYDVEDVNGKRYPIKKVTTPYASDSIFQIFTVSNYGVTPTTGVAYSTIKVTTAGAHTYAVGQAVNLFGTTLVASGQADKTLDDNYIISKIVSSTEFLIVSKYGLSKINSNNPDLAEFAVEIPVGYSLDLQGKTRLVPFELNTRPYQVQIVVSGNIDLPQLINYTDGSGNELTGFMISPKQATISSFDFNLSPIQQILLSPAPINPTPWPRRIVTKNPQHLLSDSPFNFREDSFTLWLQQPSNLYLKDNPTDVPDVAFSDLYSEYRLVRALALDETNTNQLMRRAVPPEMVSELNDTEDAYFQRFILVAGWFFDQIYLYIKFLKYVHHLNYSDFNQLSPEYYKMYADYYGFDLFNDDSIDFSKLVIKTEPGFYFINEAEDANNKYLKRTLKQLQYERQKRLLLSLFYLYRSKGTSGTIKKLVSLLGAPEGFLIFNEYSFNATETDDFDYHSTSFQGKKTVDNEKVYVPDFHFEVDPDYPTEGNLPPVYRMRLHNESKYNLRSASMLTNPNGAVDHQIINLFGKQKYHYAKFSNGEFANLQPLNDDFSLKSDYYGLPLTLPDKFAGITVEYMIPRDGFHKGVGNNLEEVSCHLCSLYQIGSSNVPDVINKVHVYPLPEVFSNFDFHAVRTHATDTNPILGNTLNILFDNLPEGATLLVTEDGYFIIAEGGDQVLFELTDEQIAVVTTVLQKNTIDDYTLLSQYLTASNNISITNPYVIVRMEGEDLVIRVRLEKELASGAADIGERVAIRKGMFKADGLNHSLRLIFRPEGVEVYEDYSHLGIQRSQNYGIVEWRDPTSNPSGIPYCAFEIPKSRISLCSVMPFDGNVFYALPDNDATNNVGTDNPKYWDMFVGMPINVDVYFKRINVFEGYGVDSFNIKDRLLNDKNYTGEYYSFDFKNNQGDSTDINIRAEFAKVQPDIVPADYDYILPVEQFNSTIVVKKLGLSSKSFIRGSDGFQLPTTKHFHQKQNFFEYKRDIFAENAYMKGIHKAYEYENFSGKVNKLYMLYSPQVLTYDLLSDFLDLIENKFKKIIKDFIPIVINISEFGRMVANSMFIQPKMRYTDIEKYCTGAFVGNKAVIQIRPYDTLRQGDDIRVQLTDGVVDVFDFTITWKGSTAETLAEIIIHLRTLNTFPVVEGYMNDDLMVITYRATDISEFDDITFKLTDEQPITLSSSFKYGYGTLGEETDCGYLEYRLPFRRSNAVYIFNGNEEQPPRFIYHADENKPPLYIN